MSRSNLIGWCVLASLGGATAAAQIGCSTELRRRVMHFFFEYPARPPAAAAATAGENTASPRPASETLPAPAEPPARFGSRHPPFIQRKCQNCHIRGTGQAPRPDFMAACKNCHEKRFAYHRYGHAPVVAHACRRCHFMHVSKQKALLKAPQRVLCTQCHPAQQNESALSSYHRNIDTLQCTACHDPHFADNQLLLKPEEDRRRARSALELGRADEGRTE